MIVLALAATTGVTDTGPLTTTALIMIAVFAVIVVLGILWGTRQKRIRAAAEREEADRAATLAEHPAAPPAPPVEPATAATPVILEPIPAAAPVTRKSPPPAKPAAKAAPAERAAKPAKPPAPKRAAPSPKAAEPVRETAPPAATTGYTLIDVKGLGPKAMPLLAEQGVSDLASLAQLTSERAALIDGQLGALSGRLGRDRWVEQAKLLTAGKIEEFEATFGKL